MTEVPESGADTGNDKTTHAKAVVPEVPETVFSELGSEKSDKKWGSGSNDDFAWSTLVLSPVQEIIAQPAARAYTWASGVGQSLARESLPGSVSARSYYFNRNDNRDDNRGDNRGQPFVPLRTTFTADTGIRQSVFEALSVPRLQGNDLIRALEGLEGLKMSLVTAQIEPVKVKPPTDTQTSTDQQSKQQEYKLVRNPDTGEMQLVVTDGSGRQRTIAVTKTLNTKDQVVLSNGTAVVVPKDVRIKGVEAISTYIQKQAAQQKDRPMEFSLTRNGEPLTIVKRPDGTLAVLSRTNDFKDVERAVARANKEPVSSFVPVGDGKTQLARQVLFQPNQPKEFVAQDKVQKKDQLAVRVPTTSRDGDQTGDSRLPPKVESGGNKVAGFAPKPLTFNDVFTSNSRSSDSRGSLKLGGELGAGLSSGPIGFVHRNIDSPGTSNKSGREPVGKVGMVGSPTARAQSDAINRSEAGAKPDYINMKTSQMVPTNTDRTDQYMKLQRLHDLREGVLDPKPGTGAGRLTADQEAALKAALQKTGADQKTVALKDQDQIPQSLQRGPGKVNFAEVQSQFGPESKLSGFDKNGLAAKLNGRTDQLGGLELSKMDKGAATGTPARVLGTDKGSQFTLSGSIGSMANPHAVDKVAPARLPSGDRLDSRVKEQIIGHPQAKGDPNNISPLQEQLKEQAGRRTITGTRPTTDLSKQQPGVEKLPTPIKPGVQKEPQVQPLVQPYRGVRVRTDEVKPIADALNRPIKQSYTDLQGKLSGQPSRIDTPRTPNASDVRKTVSQAGKIVGNTIESLNSNFTRVKDAVNKSIASDSVTKSMRTGDGSAYTPIKISRNFGNDSISKTIAVKGDKVVDLPNKRVTSEARVAKAYTTNSQLDLASKHLVDKVSTDIRIAGKRNESATAPRLDSAKTKASVPDVSRGLTAKLADATRYLAIRKEQAANGDKSYTVRLNNNNIKQIVDRSLVSTRNQPPAEKGQRQIIDNIKTQTPRLNELQASGRRPVERQITINPKELSDKQITSGRSLAEKLSGNRTLIDKGIVHPADKGIVRPADKGIARPADKGIARPADKGIVHPADKGIVRPADYGIARPADKGIVRPADKGIVHPADRGIVHPADRQTKHALADKVIENASRILGDRSAVRILTSADRSAEKTGGDSIVSSKDRQASSHTIPADRQPAIARNLVDNSIKAVHQTNEQNAIAGQRVADRPDSHIATSRAENAITQYVVRIAEKGIAEKGNIQLAECLPQLTPARAHELIGKSIQSAESSHAKGETGSRIAGERELPERALGARDRADLKGLLQLETKTGKFTINIDGIKRDIGEKKIKYDDYSLRNGMLNCADKRYLTGIELLLAGLATISAVARVRTTETTVKSVDTGKEMQNALPGLTIESWDGNGDEEEETLLELAVKRGLVGNIDRSTVLTRPKYMVQPGDTLTSIAGEVLHDSMLGWLILHINAGLINTQWEGDICLTELELRQEIELPVAQDIVEFYRSRPNLRFKNKRLVTTQKQNTFDRELLVNNFRNVIAGATARKAQDLPAM